jgi:hypothetical protein
MDRLFPPPAGLPETGGKRLQWANRCLTASLRALPDFVIIGAQRAGTTSLYSHLSDHPDVVPAYCKEVHYFDVNSYRSANWYRAHFPLRSELDGGRMTGEATPRYLVQPGADERLQALLPSSKLIVLLRNPADRALSHYFFLYGKDAPVEEFRQAVEREAQALGSGGPLDDGAKSYLGRGVYVEQLERWFSLFPREQILVLQSERFLAEPRETLARVQQFLGLREALEDDYRRLHATSYPELDESLRTWLAEFFRPHNERLFQLLAERFDWR